MLDLVCSVFTGEAWGYLVVGDFLLEYMGCWRSLDHLPIACKDSVAILFMFELTSRCTLNSAVEWYSQARKWNKGFSRKPL
ncbi:hypothetical protein Tsubulata_033925 [Turnera subulata]|uniref:Uncharacterized protein n=1 Tax=Turnera subulata TaxID=218843 RepID=A0A9Q0JPQ6_9ROSI|nr:hypothetical protein Tsubulata_033925 [Turnera subulata]